MKELESVYCWYFLLIAVVAYFIGTFNFAAIYSRFKKGNILEEGSGNPGTLNMARTYGTAIGGLTMFLDGLKGGIPALVCWIIFRNYVFAGTEVFVADFARYFCTLFVIIGHIFPVTMKFKGGKGIASTWGALLFCLPCDKWWYFFIALAILLAAAFYVIIFEIGSVGSLIGVSVLSGWQALIFVMRYDALECLTNGYVIATLMFLLLINILTWTAHRKNLVSLMVGEEHHTRVFKKKEVIKFEDDSPTGDDASVQSE